MNLHKYLESYRYLKTAVFVLACVCGALTVLCVTLAVTSAFKKRTVVVVPAFIDEVVEVTANQANTPYKRMFAFNIAQLLGNVTPETVGYVEQALPELLSGRIRSTIMKGLTEQIEDVRLERTSTRFISEKITYEPQTDKVFVVGRQTVESIAGPKETLTVTYEFVISTVNFRPVVDHFRNYEGQPRTLDVIAAERAKSQDDSAGGSR